MKKITFYSRRSAFALALLGRPHKNPALLWFVPCLAAVVTYSNFVRFRVENVFIASISALVLFLVLCVSLGLIGMLSSLVSVAFLKKSGQVCDHSLELSDDGLLETTDVNKTTVVYQEVQMPYRRFGVWVFPVGPGVHAFRPKDIKHGDLDEFVAELSARVSNAKHGA